MRINNKVKLLKFFLLLSFSINVEAQLPFAATHFPIANNGHMAIDTNGFLYMTGGPFTEGMLKVDPVLGVIDTILFDPLGTDYTLPFGIYIDKNNDAFIGSYMNLSLVKQELSTNSFNITLPIQPSSFFNNKTIRIIEESDSTKLITSRFFLCRVKNNTQVVDTLFFQSQLTRTLIDAQHHIWVSTGDYFGYGGSGLFELDSLGNVLNHYTASNGLLNDYTIMDIAIDQQNNKWIGGPGGLTKLSSSGSFSHYTMDDGLVDSMVSVLTIDDANRLWIGTSNGISVFDPQTNAVIQNYDSAFFSINTHPSLAMPNYIYNIETDNKHNRIWISAWMGSVVMLQDTTGFYMRATQPQLWVPNAFTPNGDGSNDAFTISSWELTELQVSIFNRWGKLIYKWNSLSGGWDGTYKGRSSEEGVYIYVIKAKGKDNTLYNKTGHITLLR